MSTVAMLPATLGRDGRRRTAVDRLRDRPRARLRAGRPRAASTPSATSASPASRRSRAASYPSMYRGRLWTMRQYAGMATAEETNQRFRYLLDHGQTGLSVAFDLPTQMGLDSDHPRAEGEVGKTGVAIDSIEDMDRLLDGIPLDAVSTSMTINATAPILLLLYELVAEERGIDAADAERDRAERPAEGVRGPRDLHLPAEALDAADHRSVRLLRRDDPAVEHDLDQRLPHARGRGDRRRRRSRSRSRTASPTCRRRSTRGSTVDEFAPRLSFFFACHMNFFEEIAKFRAARRMWATIMAERFGAKDPRSLMLRFHTQTGGATLTAQQPREQHRAHRARGARGGPRRDAVAAHELVRRGARAADRAGREDRAADPAGDRARDRGDAHRRPARRLVLRRGAHERGRGARAGATSSGSTGWAARSRRSRPASTRTRSPRPRSGSSRGSSRASAWSSGVNRFEDAEEQPVEIQAIGEEEVARQVERVRRAPRLARPGCGGRGRSPTCGRRPRGRRTCCRR